MSIKETKRDRAGDNLFMVEREHSFAYTGEQRDMVRYVIGSYWNSTRDGSLVDKKPILLSQTSSPAVLHKVEYLGTSERESGTFETIKIKPAALVSDGSDKEIQERFERFNTLMSQAGKRATYEDHACEFNTYERNSNKKEEELGLLNLYMTVEPNYNFFSPDYELSIVENEILETSLPSFYNIVFNAGKFEPHAQTEEVRTTTSLPRDVLTMFSNVRLPVLRNFNENWESLTNPIADYCETWANKIGSIGTAIRARLDNEADRQKRTYFTKSETEKMNSLSKFREMMPMYVRVQFQTEIESGFGSTLAETNYFSKIRDYVSVTNPSAVPTYEVVSRVSETGFPTLAFGSPPALEKVRLHSRPFYDVENFFKENLDVEPRDSFYFSDVPTQENDRYRAYYTMMTAIAKAKLESIKNKKTRSYKDILAGKKAHSETVMYTIRKYDEDDRLIQSFYFTNSDELKEIDFIDSQVVYKKTYRYELSAIKLIIGSKYTYNLVANDNTGATYEVNVQPSLKLCEVALLSDTAMLMDNPPLPPEIVPVPILNVDNRVQFMLNTSIGRAKMKPVIFTSEEEQDVAIFRKAQKIPDGQKEILYETDDHVGEYEIYKLEFPPTSYEDFYSFGERIVTKTVHDDSIISSSSTYEDSIKPNNKYYYCARTRDSHAHISNPSMCWEVELVSDGGTCYPAFKEYKVEPVLNTVHKRSVKRFIQIAPANLQKIVNDDASRITGAGPEINQEVYLGMSEERIWGKKFKLRLTSKTTGRKVDFDFVFDTKKIITPTPDQ